MSYLILQYEISHKQNTSKHLQMTYIIFQNEISYKQTTSNKQSQTPLIIKFCHHLEKFQMHHPPTLMQLQPLNEENNDSSLTSNFLPNKTNYECTTCQAHGTSDLCILWQRASQALNSKRRCHHRATRIPATSLGALDSVSWSPHLPFSKFTIVAQYYICFTVLALLTF